MTMASGKVGGAISAKLYDRVRHESSAFKAQGLFVESPSDDGDACPDAAILKINRSRLKFYERYGARPVINTAYASPVADGDICMPYLVYDGLESQKPLGKEFARKVVRAILERKYAKTYSADDADKVVSSFKDDPVRLRDFVYIKPEAAVTKIVDRTVEQIALVVSERHEILNIADEEYVEAPIRIRSILSELEKSDMFVRINSKSFPDTHLLAVHDPAFIECLQKTCLELPDGKLLYPHFASDQDEAHPPEASAVLLGHFCIDTFTPVTSSVYPAARDAVDAALTATNEILSGRQMAYALVRPPGHHTERGAYGGFCFLNNTAIAAQFLSDHGRVAILDVDYHHGNGQQNIFYRRSDVLTVSIHGSPEFAYPHYCGFADEKGEGEGEGFNLNLPLPEKINPQQYQNALKTAIRRVKDFNTQFLVVPLGLDPAKDDPTGTWSLTAEDFEENGRLIGALGLSTLVIQEGGYRVQTLGKNATAFFKGLVDGYRKWTDARRQPRELPPDMTLRYDVASEDGRRIRELVKITGFFSPDEVDIAEELVTERISRGDKSGYYFVLAENDGRLIGYTCYGPIAGTVASYDLYWIAVHPDFQGQGAGRKLLEETEKLIAAAGGSRIYVETSQRDQYASTRAFYQKCSYTLEGILKDFYAPGDGKAIYCKALG